MSRGCSPKFSFSRIDKLLGVPGEQRPNRGADRRAHESEPRTEDAARDVRAKKFALVTAAHCGADGESSSKSDKRSDGGTLAPSPAARTEPLYLEHVLSSCGHRPCRHLLRRPVLECTFRRSGFQGQSNAIACPQLSKGLPVVPILPLSGRPERTYDYNRQE